MVSVRGTGKAVSRTSRIAKRRTEAKKYNTKRTIRTQQQAQTRRRNKGYDPNRAPDGEGWYRKRRMKTDGPDVPYWAKKDSKTTDRARTFPIGGGNHRARFF